MSDTSVADAAASGSAEKEVGVNLGELLSQLHSKLDTLGHRVAQVESVAAAPVEVEAVKALNPWPAAPKVNADQQVLIDYVHALLTAAGMAGLPK
jgi:hypothetical protein